MSDCDCDALCLVCQCCECTYWCACCCAEATAAAAAPPPQQVVYVPVQPVMVVVSPSRDPNQPNQQYVAGNYINEVHAQQGRAIATPVSYNAVPYPENDGPHKVAEPMPVAIPVAAPPRPTSPQSMPVEQHQPLMVPYVPSSSYSTPSTSTYSYSSSTYTTPSYLTPPTLQPIPAAAPPPSSLQASAIQSSAFAPHSPTKASTNSSFV